MLRLEWVDPTTLEKNPRNWRIHPGSQREAVADLLGEVGWAGALLYNEKTGRLIDGHLRLDLALRQAQDVADGESVPVLIGSWTEEQERLILATLDPTGALAEADDGQLADLINAIETGSEAIQMILVQQRAESELAALMARVDKELSGLIEPRSWELDGYQKLKLIKVVLVADDLKPLEQAILATGNPNRGEAMMEICRAYLNEKG